MRALGVLPEQLWRLLRLKPDEVGRMVESDAGAEGWTIDIRRRRLLALRWQEGVAVTVREYDFEAVRARHDQAKRADRRG